MVFRATIGLAAALLLAAGCRSNDEQYALMQRELRLQEDRIYQLEGYIEQYQALLEARDAELGQSEDVEPELVPSREMPSIRRDRSRREQPAEEIPDLSPDVLAPPSIDLGEPDSTPPPVRKPVTEDLLPDDPLPSLPNLDGARAPRGGRARLGERPLFKSAARPLQRLRQNLTGTASNQAERRAASGPSRDAGNVAPRWEGSTPAPEEAASPAARPPTSEAASAKQAKMPEWQPYR